VTAPSLHALSPALADAWDRASRRERALIALYSPRDHEEFVVTQILAWNAAGIRFDFTTDAARRQALLGAGSIVVVAFLERIKIQFAAGRLRAGDDGGRPVMDCELPRQVHRIQRRDAFRVRPPPVHPAECVIRSVGGVERVYRVLDVSAGRKEAARRGLEVHRTGRKRPDGEVTRAVADSGLAEDRQ